MATAGGWSFRWLWTSTSGAEVANYRFLRWFFPAMKVMKVLKAQQLRETEQIIGSSSGRGPFLPNYFGGIHFRHELFSKDEYRSIYLSSQPTLSFFFPFRTLFWFRREISNTSIKINMAAEKMIGSLCVESFFQVSEAQSTWPREEEEVAVWCSKVGFFDIFALCTPSNWWEKRGEKTWWNVNMNLWICFLF